MLEKVQVLLSQSRQTLLKPGHSGEVPVPLKREGVCDLLPHRAPHGLIKVRQQGLREVAVYRETSFNRGP